MAQHLANLVEKVGAARLLSGAKDLTDRILPAVVKLAQDSSQEVRYVKKNKKKKNFHINSFNFCVLTSLQLVHICLNGEIIFLCIANEKHSAITDNSQKMSNLRHFKSL